MKKEWVILAVVVVIAAILVGVFVGQKNAAQKEVETLSAQVTALEGQVNVAAQQLEEASAATEEANAALTAAQADVETAKSEAEAAKAEAFDLQQQLEAAQTTPAEPVATEPPAPEAAEEETVAPAAEETDEEETAEEETAGDETADEEEAAQTAAAAPKTTTIYEPGPKLGDVRVRQALMYALNRKDFILAEYGSEELARVGLAPVSPTSWAFPDEGSLNPYDYDLDKAGELLDEAGWVMGDDGYRYKDGEKLSLDWLVYTDSTWPGTLSSMAFDSWKQIGVELNIELMDFNTVSERTMDAEPGEKDFDIYTMGFSLSIDPDPSGALFDFDAFTAGGFNASGYYNEHAQDLIKQGKLLFEQDDRAPIYQEWATIMNEEVPTAIVAYRSEIWGVNDRVKGLDTMTAFAKWDDIITDIELEGDDQILKFGETSFDGNFNTIMADQVYDSYINDLVFDGLVKNDREGEWEPRLATWELIGDNKTYEFTIDADATFSDGTPVTSDDVLFTFMMIAHPDYTGPRLYAVSGLEGYDEYAAGTADTISGINVIDDHKIAFTFREASPANIESFEYGILPRGYYEADTFEGFLSTIDAPVGCGPFVLTEYAPGQYIRLEKNENYYNQDRQAKIDGIYVTIVPDESKVPALQLGEIDFAQLSASMDNVEAIEGMDGQHLVSYLGNGYTFMCFNTLH